MSNLFGIPTGAVTNNVQNIQSRIDELNKKDKQSLTTDEINEIKKLETALISTKKVDLTQPQSVSDGDQPINYSGPLTYNDSMTILTNLMGNIEKVKNSLDGILSKVISIKQSSTATIEELESTRNKLNENIVNHQENIQTMVEQLNVSKEEKQQIEDELQQLKDDNTQKDNEIETLITSQKQLQNDITKVIDLVTKHKETIDVFNNIPDRLTAFIQDHNMAGGFNWRTPKSKSSSQRVKLQTKRSKRSVSSVNKKYKTQRNKKLFPFFKNKKNKK